MRNRKLAKSPLEGFFEFLQQVERARSVNHGMAGYTPHKQGFRRIVAAEAVDATEMKTGDIIYRACPGCGGHWYEVLDASNQNSLKAEEIEAHESVQ